MSRLLSTTLIATLSLSAGTSEAEVKDYIKNHMVNNSRIKVVSVDMISKKELKSPKGWEVYFVNIHAEVKKSATVTDKVNVPETIFVKDGYAVPTLIDIKTGKDIKSQLKPDLDPKLYDKKHLFAGNEDAKHKILLFSDPQCPFCKEKVPEIYKVVKANPKVFALYYYHMPLLRIHPVSDAISRVMVIEQRKGHFDRVIDMYSLEFNPREVNATKILGKINKKYGLNITEKDIDAQDIADELKHDQDMATKSMVAGTPTIYLDGKWDKSRNAYKKLIP
jgi:protein-disulfide isomerase